jgi:hypothetical protein
LKGPRKLFEGSAQAAKLGDYSLVPTSSLFATAPGQAVTVHVVNKPAATVLSGTNYYLLKDSVAPFYLYSWTPGDSLLVTSDDPSRLLVGADSGASAASVTLTSGSLYLAALAGEGSAGLHVVGTYNGKPVSEAVQVRLVPYQVNFSATVTRVGVGVTLSPNITLLPQVTADLSTYRYLQGDPRPAALGNLFVQSSNPAVLQSQGRGAPLLSFSFLALQPGMATLSFAPPFPAEFARVAVTVQVVPAAVDFGVSVIRIPAGGTAGLLPLGGTTAPNSALQSVRLRLNSETSLLIQSYGVAGTGTDLTVDLTRQGFTLLAQKALTGHQATLYVSAPGLAEFPLPIHVVDPVFIPDSAEVRAVGSGGANYHMAALDGGQVFEFAVQAQLPQGVTVTVHPVTNPSGICTAGPVDVIGSGSFTVPITCTATGVTQLTLPPEPRISSAETQYSGVRVVSQPASPVPVTLPSRIFVGNGLQAELSMYFGSLGPFSGTLTSSDPDRVRLSIDRNAPGSASVTLPADRSIGSVFVQGYASDGVVTLSAVTPDGRTGAVTVYLFPSTLAVRQQEQSFASDLSPVLSLDQPVSMPDFPLSVRPYLVDPGSQKLLWNSNLSIRGGSDPVFVRGQTSDASIVQTVPPDAIVSESDKSAVLNFHAHAVGSAILSATQPTGFIAVPDSSLRTNVFQRSLSLGQTVVLSADLQTSVGVFSPGSGNVAGVTATSLDPQKLVLSLSASTPGQASVTVPQNGYVSLQALSGVQPGDHVDVRLEAPGYLTSISTVQFAAAELQNNSAIPLSVQPLTNSNLTLVYGPVNSLGSVSFSGSIRPGVNLPVQFTSSDPNIIGVTQQSIPLDTFMTVPLRPLTPGHAQILVQAPPQITNRAAALDVVVGPYQFPGLQLDYASRYLVSKFTVTNPRSQSITATVASSGFAPVRLGTASSGAGAPASSPLTLTLNANETRTLYLEPAGAGNSLQVQLTAPDFAPQTGFQSVNDPFVNFLETGPFNLSLSGGSVPLTLILSVSNGKQESPLGTAYGPLTLQVQSSNPKVVSVPTAPVVFNPGDSRKSVVLQPVSAGDTVVSVIVPASFAGTSPARQDILVSVR